MEEIKKLAQKLQEKEEENCILWNIVKKQQEQKSKLKEEIVIQTNIANSFQKLLEKKHRGEKE